MAITVSRHTTFLANEKEFTTYRVSPGRVEYQLALHAITHWGNARDLVEFARAGHGYGNSDSMCGIIYASDVDDYAREIEKVIIPAGYVQAYAAHVEVKEKNLTEREYLMILKSFFEVNHQFDYADAIHQEILKQRDIRDM